MARLLVASPFAVHAPRCVVPGAGGEEPMADPTNLERRIQALEDIEAIKRLKHRYWRCLDLKLWDELAGCFAPDASVDYGEGRYRFQGVEAIMRFLTQSLGRESGALGVHHGGHPEIELTGATTAHG